MVKFMVMFHPPSDLNTFERNYNQFLALIERMPDIQRRQVINVAGSSIGTPRYYRILEIYFADMAQMQESLRSKAGQEAGWELSRVFPADTVEALFAEVYEEAGGSTPV